MVTDNKTQLINLKIRMKVAEIVKERKNDRVGAVKIQRTMIEKLNKAQKQISAKN